MTGISEGRHSSTWPTCFQYFSKHWPLLFEELDYCLTPITLHHTLHIPLDSSVSPTISSVLTSYTYSNTKYSFALMMVPNYLWELWFCPALLSYKILISWGINSQKTTTNFTRTFTLIFLLMYSRLAFSFCGLMNFLLLPLLLLLEILLNMACYLEIY